MSVSECGSFEIDKSTKNLNQTNLEERFNSLQIESREIISPSSSRGSISPSLLDDLEINPFSPISPDELPIFTIKSISPTGRSLSPIDSDDFFLDDLESPRFNMAVSPENIDDENDCDNSQLFEDLMTLDEIHERINTPSMNIKATKNLNLETIFEGVFLETPPKEKNRNNYS